MAEPPKKEKACPALQEWLNTYGDMVTLLLTFFVLMYTDATTEGYKMNLILSAFSGLGMFGGGNTLEVGQLAELGNTIESLPSMQRGRALDSARQRAVSLFQTESRSRMVRITQDERGLVISFAADVLFAPASAEVNIDAVRETLQKVSSLLIGMTQEDPGLKYRIEGHTDNIGTDPAGPWPSNWELSAQRSINVLHYLSEFGVEENNFQVAGFADTMPLVSNDTPEGRAYNRRVDIVIITEGNL
ncbi:MAG: flagellar motor protein MotB [Spirochaetales bacterium]|jgi:chemotaxis protein MotB|nr:flagellar motor protein MotB [Spirochaetales bacterium]